MRIKILKNVLFRIKETLTKAIYILTGCYILGGVLAIMPYLLTRLEEVNPAAWYNGLILVGAVIIAIFWFVKLIMKVRE